MKVGIAWEANRATDAASAVGLGPPFNFCVLSPAHSGTSEISRTSPPKKMLVT